MGFGDFAAGAASAGSEDINARRQSALELKMRSSLIAQQGKQAMAENAQKEQLSEGAEQERYERENTLSPDVSQTIKDNLAEGTQLGLTKIGGLDMSSIKPGPLHIKDAQYLMTLRNNKMQSHAFSAITGKEPVLDPTTGITVGYQNKGLMGDMGKPIMLPGSSDKVKEGISLINSAKDLGQAKDMLRKIDFGRLQGFANNAEAYVGMNPDVVNYNNLRAFIATEMPKTLAGFTRYNEPEFKRLYDTIPSVHATPGEVKQWINTYDKVLGGRMTSLGMNAGLYGVVGNLEEAPAPQADASNGSSLGSPEDAANWLKNRKGSK